MSSCTKIDPKLKKLQKTVKIKKKNCQKLLFSEGFSNFIQFGLNLSAPTHQSSLQLAAVHKVCRPFLGREGGPNCRRLPTRGGIENSKFAIQKISDAYCKSLISHGFQVSGQSSHEVAFEFLLHKVIFSLSVLDRSTIQKKLSGCI